MGVERCRERLVTGSGYIAGFLIRQLLAEGWRVHATLRDPAKGPPCVPCWVERRNASFFPVDLLSDHSWVEALAGVPMWRMSPSLRWSRHVTTRI
jgi:nucleoside-diphosphate-sugar epimerase